MKIVKFIVVFSAFLWAQDSTITKIDSLNLFQNDSLKLKLDYSGKNKIPKNIIAVPRPMNPLEIDMRTSSYYTPREVQDKMDHIMQRPRSDTFVPVLAMAAFAVSVAAKQLEAYKLFEPKAHDYLLTDKEILILEKLWLSSPRTIEELYKESDIQADNTAATLQDDITNLAEKNLIKTKTVSKNNVLFFAGQKIEEVKSLLRTANIDTSNEEDVITKYKQLLDRLEKIN